MPKTTIEISWVSLWRVVAVILLGLAFYLAREVALAFLLSLVISSAIDGPVTRLEKKRVPRILGTLMIFLGAAFILLFIIYNVLPIVIFEFTALLKNLGGLNLGLENNTSEILSGIYKELLIPDISGLTSSLLKGSASLFGVIGKILSGFAFIFSVLVVSFYLTLSRDGVERFLRHLFPDESEDYVSRVYSRSKRKIGRWLQAQIILSFVIGLLVFIGLSIAKAKYSLLIGLLAAFFEIIPVVGPIFSGSVAILISFTVSPALALWTLSIFAAVHLLESNIFVPVFMQKALDIHPVVVIISLMVGLQIAGVIGMILAVPLAVVIQELVANRPKPPQFTKTS